MRSSPVLGCLLAYLVSIAHGAPSHAVQKPLGSYHGDSTIPKYDVSASKRKLTGKFLHITDMHPDPFYKIHSATDSDSSCHRGDGPAGIYGAETTACDSPLKLLDSTFKWLEDNLKGEIDFIIWTGDSARHDNDEKIPRNEEQVIGQNKMLVDKFREVFGVDDDDDGRYPTGFSVPIIPSIGNNDMLPHNIFEAGPNSWTKHFAELWRPFIPEEQRHGFDRGGWFYVEVIPNKLAVFSLNTMYFFAKNSAVDGCASESEPGYEHFEWLRIQLQFLRERGMKAIMTGHVPPARNDDKVMWDETCWQKFALWNKQYRDIIIGGMYGHMNIEHFMFQDFNEIDLDVVSGMKTPSESIVELAKVEDDDKVSIQAKAPQYLSSLRELWAALPTVPSGLENDTSSHTWGSEEISSTLKHSNSEVDKFFGAIGGKYAERFALSFVSASVVPNYFPTLRVFEYNITGLEDHELDGPVPKPPHNWQRRRKSSGAHPRKKPSFTVPEGPSKSEAPGPAYSAQSLSWLGYKQYFANITYLNNDENDSSSEGVDDNKHDPRKFEYHVEYDTRHHKDRYYMHHGLEMRKWVQLAARIGNYVPPDDHTSLSLASESQDLETVSNEMEEVDETEDVGTAKKHKHKKHKKHHKKHKRHHKRPHKKLSKQQKRMAKKAWKAFVIRGTVSTISTKDLKDDFGTPPDDDDDDDEI